MNTELGNKAKNNFEKDYFMLINNVDFRKTIGNVRQHRNNKIVTNERRRNYLVSESHYHTTKFLWKIY